VLVGGIIRGNERVFVVKQTDVISYPYATFSGNYQGFSFDEVIV
jgi:hypothetical protein